MSFETRFTVRFGDVDHARVVYLPRYFHLFHQTFEEWFGAGLGLPYATVVGARNIGFPTVHAETRFRRPLRYGDEVRATLRVERVSTRSIVCAYSLERASDGEIAAESSVTVTCVDNDSFQAIAIPQDIRGRIEAFANNQGSVGR